jgi:hypothetical protein
MMLNKCSSIELHNQVAPALGEIFLISSGFKAVWTPEVVSQ